MKGRCGAARSWSQPRVSARRFVTRTQIPDSGDLRGGEVLAHLVHKLDGVRGLVAFLASELLEVRPTHANDRELCSHENAVEEHEREHCPKSCVIVTLHVGGLLSRPGLHAPCQQEPAPSKEASMALCESLTGVAGRRDII